MLMDFNFSFKCACGYASHPCYLKMGKSFTYVSHYQTRIAKNVTTNCHYKMLLQIITTNQSKLSCISYVFNHFPLVYFVNVHELLFILLWWKLSLWSHIFVQHFDIKVNISFLSHFHCLQRRKMWQVKLLSGWHIRNSSLKCSASTNNKKVYSSLCLFQFPLIIFDSASCKKNPIILPCRTPGLLP